MIRFLCLSTKKGVGNKRVESWDNPMGTNIICTCDGAWGFFLYFAVSFLSILLYNKPLLPSSKKLVVVLSLPYNVQF